MGVSTLTVLNWEHGTHVPSHGNARRLSDLFGKPDGWFVQEMPATTAHADLDMFAALLDLIVSNRVDDAMNRILADRVAA